MNLVPEAGLEPARFLRRGILNPNLIMVSPGYSELPKDD